jgi:hypothetical protein
MPIDRNYAYMNAQIVNPPPDVSRIYTMDSTEINDVNDRLRRGWVLLAVLVEREVSEKGSFTDKEFYVLGMKRGHSGEFEG